MKDLENLASQQADAQLLRAAEEACTGRLDLHDAFAALKASQPSRRDVHAFIENAKGSAPRSLDEQVALVCRTLGVDQPTGIEKLLALQALLMQEHASSMRKLLNEVTSRSDGKAPSGQDGSTTALLGGLLLAAVTLK